jgi:hypothetical protein
LRFVSGFASSLHREVAYTQIITKVLVACGEETINRGQYLRGKLDLPRGWRAGLHIAARGQERTEEEFECLLREADPIWLTKKWCQQVPI